MKKLLSLIPAVFGLSPVYAYGAIAGLVVVVLSFAYGCRSYNKHVNYRKQEVAIDKVQDNTIKEGQKDVQADIDYLKELRGKNKPLKGTKHKEVKDSEFNALKEALKKKQFKRLGRVLK